MIRVLLILLIALLVGTGLSLGLTYDLGYIRISLGNYLIETNFWVGLCLILVIILLSVTFINTVRRFRRGTGVMAGWLARGNERRRADAPHAAFWLWRKATGLALANY